MKELRCPLCGREKIENCGNGTYHCAYCGSTFRDEFVEEQLDMIKSALGGVLYAQREEDIANARCNLWNAVHDQYTDSERVIACCRELKSYLPKDFMANFYEVANGSSEYEINRFLDGIDEKKYFDFLPEVLEFILKSLELKNVGAAKGLIERAYPKDSKEYIGYTTRVEDEASRLDEGMYLASLPRDVFLAYSSADMVRVNEVADYLESQGLKCFIALRNLRHGRGAVQNYEERIFEAMRNCKCFVFLSSEQSRSLGCDALKIEVPYLRELPQMPRVEYLLQDYGMKTMDAAKILLKETFKGLEWSTTKEDLLKNITNAVTAQPKAQGKNVKYCLACGTENPTAAKRCMECGGANFADSYKTYLEAKAEEQRKEDEAEIERKRQEMLAAAEIERKRIIEEAQNQSYKFCLSCGAQNLQTAKFCCACAKTQFGTLTEYRQKLEERKQQPLSLHYDKAEFEIEDTTLKKYIGGGGNVEIPQGVTSIGEGAFEDCSGLTGITIPDSVTTIGDHAFSFCYGLTGITIPDSVTTIGARVFAWCSRLKRINVKENNPTYQSIDGNLYSKDGETLIRYAIGKTDSTFKIPDSVTTIGNSAFEGCSRLTRITIPDSVTSIGEGAFGCCSGLTKIDFKGRKAQWEKIYKGRDWNSYSAIKTVHCLDGGVGV